MASGVKEQVVVLLVQENPKRPGSKARERFAKYEMGMTRQQALKAGVTEGDLGWDVGHGFINLVSPKQWKAMVETFDLLSSSGGLIPDNCSRCGNNPPKRYAVAPGAVEWFCEKCWPAE